MKDLQNIDEQLRALGLFAEETLGVENDFEEDFEFARYTQSGYNNHTNTGYSNHSNYAQNNHSRSGYSASSYYYQSSSSGCSNHSDYGYSDKWYSNSYSNHSQYEYQDSGCNQGTHSNCYNYYAHGRADGCVNSSGGCSNHTDSGYSNRYSDYYYEKDYSNHTNTGCSNTVNTGCTNYSQSGYNNHVNYMDNNPPTLSGVMTPNSGQFNQSISISWPAASDVLIPGQPAENKFTYNLHWRHKPAGSSTWGAWAWLATATNTSYVWNTSAIANGKVQLALFASDGIEWSGGINADGSLYGSYLLTQEIAIVHYQSPSWTNPITPDLTIIYKIDHDELRREINKARENFGLAKTSFTGGETWAADSKISVVFNELRTSANQAAVAAGKPQKTFTQQIKNGTIIKGQDTLEIRELLDSLDD